MTAALYDLATARPTYNFCVWLERVWQEGYRKVAIRPGPKQGFQRKRFPPVQSHERRFMLENVMLPAIPRFGLTLTDGGEWLEDFSFRRVVENYRGGLGIRHPEASVKARQLVSSWVRRPYITVTLRETPKHPERNSNMEAWCGFIAEAESRINVCVVPDTENANTGCGWAAINLDLRLALYEGAEMNFGVANGPTSMLYLMAAPYCVFKQIVPTVSPMTEKGWRKTAGLSIGEQFPWAGERQRMMWQDDTPEALADAARAFL